MTTDSLTFDYVIIGAGSAGCVLADRLSADGRHKVCVIEAGGSDRRLYVQMPLGYGKTFYDRSLNWAYRAEPDPGLGGNADYWPRGKLLGGSSSINAMVFIRGNPCDFDDWADEGNPGWSHADCLPFFMGLEHNAAGGNRWRGLGGPLHITDVAADVHPLGRRFLEAGLQAGLPLNVDFNAAAQDGVGTYQINTRGGRRMSAARAFLRPAMRRTNVSLMTRTHVSRIRFDGMRAIGVDAMRGGRQFAINARREIILAAGAVNTPQLLQLSGIGPGAALQALGLEVRRDNRAVGANLQDHIGINYVYASRIPSLNDVLRPLRGKLLAAMDWLVRGRGPLSFSLNQTGGFVRTRAGLDRPNIQLYLQAISTFAAKSGTRPLLTPDAFPGFGLGLSSCVPTSRGHIALRSPDPLDAPKITANALSTNADITDMLEGVKLLRRLAGQPALADVIAAELAPGPGTDGDEALIDDIRARSGTVYHPVGTARMGRAGDNAVVDARLRVHGVAALRIADASVFPKIVCGNTNAAVMMVAAKAAAMILEDARP